MAGLLRRTVRVTGWVTLVAVVAAAAALGVVTRQRAHELLTNPRETRQMPGRSPADFDVPFEDVVARTSDGLWLKGWQVPARNGVVVVLLHGYKSHRGEMVNEAAMLYRHGYGALIASLRTHDANDGDLITFGVHEGKDLEAWMQVAVSRGGAEGARIAMLGNSMGATLVIQHAASDPRVKAVIANSAFSSLEDTVETSVRFFTGLPPFPFAPLITFWAEREAGFRARDVDAKAWIGRISPRPILLMQGGTDTVISRDSGQRLFDAAGDPKELWFDPELRHTRFDTARPEEYERRVVGFLNRHLRPGTGDR